MKKRIFLIISLFAVTTVQGMSLDDIINKTIDNYKGLTSFYAEFDQIYCDEVSGTCDRFEGKLYYLKPCFYRMEMNDPKRIYVGDSASHWIYIPDENRAIKQGFTLLPVQINPDLFLRDYHERFTAELTGDEGKTYEVSLIPIDDTDVYEKIVISISKTEFEITAVKINQEIGSEIECIFSTFDINKKFPKDIFNFKPPEGTQIDEY
jgi:outer membrane lipoprotein-sorting protein